MRHFIKIMDWSPKELMDILNQADQFRYEQKHGIEHPALKGKTLGMIFGQPSTRTRVSFEVGMYQLGGSALFLTPNDLMTGQGEPEIDNIRTLSRYLDIVMARMASHEDLELLAEYSDVPIINGKTNYAHPCQTMATLMTARLYKGAFSETKLCYIGEGGSVANSLIVGAMKLGMEMTVAAPEDHAPDAEIVKWAKDNGNFLLTTDVKEASKNADILYTSEWDESIDKDMEGYCIDMDVVANAKPDVTVLHSLPARKNKEISEEVFELYANHIFDETENRLHVQKAILTACFRK